MLYISLLMSVSYMMLYTSLLSNTAPIHCTPLPLHPPCNEHPDGARLAGPTERLAEHGRSPHRVVFGSRNKSIAGLHWPIYDA